MCNQFICIQANGYTKYIATSQIATFTIEDKNPSAWLILTTGDEIRLPESDIKRIEEALYKLPRLA